MAASSLTWHPLYSKSVTYVPERLFPLSQVCTPFTKGGKLLVGRAITEADNPEAVVDEIVKSIS